MKKLIIVGLFLPLFTTLLWTSENACAKGKLKLYEVCLVACQKPTLPQIIACTKVDIQKRISPEQGVKSIALRRGSPVFSFETDALEDTVTDTTDMPSLASQEDSALRRDLGSTDSFDTVSSGMGSKSSSQDSIDTQATKLQARGAMKIRNFRIRR